MSKFKIITKGVEVIVRHKSTILKVLGIAGVGLAIADATIQGPKAKEALDKAQEEKGEEPLTTLEKVKIAGPIIARPVALGAAGVASLCTGYNIQVKELTKNCANIATAYNGLQAGTKILQEDFNNYKEATKETVGEEKEHEIHAKAGEKKIQKQFEYKEVGPIVTETGNGKVAFYDFINNSVIMSSEAGVKEAIMAMDQKRLSMLQAIEEKKKNGIGYFDEDDPKYAEQYREYIYYWEILKQLGVSPSEVAYMFRFSIDKPIRVYFEPMIVNGFEGAVLGIRFENEPEYDWSQSY